ncbi:hypothetical protein AVEN_184513-1 [Araneus ventricosus]|uniref:Uncharacterized protein n=1 Tax=Araneus ventricosus TaxID=182803 RepID=A0A4Y1ZKA3_ARAVE|nr:hypothetical protein AVEN_184513-1 [Araneus ventricosus]
MFGGIDANLVIPCRPPTASPHYTPGHYFVADAYDPNDINRRWWIANNSLIKHNSKALNHISGLLSTAAVKPQQRHGLELRTGTSVATGLALPVTKTDWAAVPTCGSGGMLNPTYVGSAKQE